MAERIKIRAHHLLGYAILGGGVNEVQQAMTEGVSGVQMYENQKSLGERLRQNPDLEVEITDTYDAVCAACPRMPGGPKYIRPKFIFTLDKTKNPRYYAEQKWRVWEKRCEDRDLEGDREVAREDLGLTIGTVLKARQVQSIARIFVKYGAEMKPTSDWTLEKAQDCIKRELEEFYRKENIAYKFFPRHEDSEEEKHNLVEEFLAGEEKEKRHIWLLFRGFYY